eukprot:COSAG06_NODE_1683_length_8730_cov_3.959912_2_plen_93_part_00
MKLCDDPTATAAAAAAAAAAAHQLASHQPPKPPMQRSSSTFNLIDLRHTNMIICYRNHSSHTACCLPACLPACLTDWCSLSYLAGGQISERI